MYRVQSNASQYKRSILKLRILEHFDFVCSTVYFGTPLTLNVWTSVCPRFTKFAVHIIPIFFPHLNHSSVIFMESSIVFDSNLQFKWKVSYSLPSRQVKPYYLNWLPSCQTPALNVKYNLQRVTSDCGSLNGKSYRKGLEDRIREENRLLYRKASILFRMERNSCTTLPRTINKFLL